MNKLKKWLKLRKEFIINFSIELVIILLIIFYTNLSFNSESLLIPYMITWVLLSYIFGRYHNEEKFNKFISYIVLFYKSLIISLTSLLSAYSICLITSNLSKNSFEYKNNIIFIIIWTIFFSGLNYLIKNNITYKFTKKEIWAFVGQEKIFKKLSEESSRVKGKFELRHFKNKLDFKKINKLKISGFCSDSFYKMSDEELQNFMDSKYNSTSTMSIQRWCEIFLECLPPKLVSKTYVLRGNFRINQKIYPRLKKLADFLVSIILLTLTSPIILFCALMIYLEDKGSIFYSQQRIGLNGKSFTIYKLRSMREDAEKEGPKWASHKDERITSIGEFIRKTRLDELPQLISVIKGEMSLIGPRPERKEFEERLEKEIPNYKIRHLIKPGLSGWAQVNYPYGASIKDAENKLSYDLYYIRNFSLFLDLLIFMKTIRLVANRKGAQPKVKRKSSKDILK